MCAIISYYDTLSNCEYNRATIFKSYISYQTVQDMVLDQLDLSFDQVRMMYSDTYDFLMSLRDGLAELNHY